MITLTDLARDEVRRIKTAQSLSPATGVRIAILGGGCSGMQYALALESEPRGDIDAVLQRDADDDVPIVTERKFEPHLEGTVIDFQNGPISHGFTIVNPNFPTTGGCPGCGG
ncbi:MAG: HesB/IscA family protein [Thermoguttaceae bacterium]